jgi:hypothetical protein
MGKQIKGVVKSYSKIESGNKDNKKFAYVDMSLLDNKYPYRFFFESEAQIKDKLLERVPIGSTVEFEIVKNGEFWNVNQKSFEVLYEGNGSTPESQKPSSENTHERIYIVRQNALSHADAKRANTKMPDDEYFKFAEECEKWVLR